MDSLWLTHWVCLIRKVKAILTSLDVVLGIFTYLANPFTMLIYTFTVHSLVWGIEGSVLRPSHAGAAMAQGA